MGALRDLDNRLISDLVDADCDVLLYAKQGRQTQDRYRRLRMNRNLAEDFKEDFSESLRQVLRIPLGDSEGLRAYAYGEGIEDTVSFLPYDAYVPVARVLEGFPNQHDCRGFDPSDGFINKLKCVYVVINFANQSEKLAIGQVRGPSRIVTRNRLMAMLINQEYERVEASEMLSFNTTVDFFVWRDYIFVSRLEAFEAFFSIREATKALAVNAVSSMIQRMSVKISIAPEVLKKVRISKKLAKLGSADHLPKLTVTKLREHITRHDLPAQIVEAEDGTWHLILDHPDDHNDQMLLLRLLDDDLYNSDLTENRYAARAKDRR